MNDERDGQGDDNVTPDEFAHLFRPDAGSPSPTPAPATPSPPNPSPAAGADPPLPVSAPAEPASGQAVADEPVSNTPSDSEPVEAASTPGPAPDGSRLFRSRGAPERDDAVTAVGSLQALRLKTMSRSGDPDTNRDLDDPAAHPPTGADNLLPAPPLPVASSGEPAPALAVMSAPAPAPSQPAVAERPRQSTRTEKPSSGSLTGLGVYAVTIGVTVILAFGETMFFGGELGLITGIGLVVVSIVAAFVVRTRDGLHAIFAPPIAFLVAALTAGQMGVTATDTSSRAVVVFFLLGNNWPWIIGATAASLVIVALRRRVG
ncbi:MAG: ABC transporter permease [Actinomycetales bacterium]|nr:ABC transporter permease [Actinomycetales bacterium]